MVEVTTTLAKGERVCGVENRAQMTQFHRYLGDKTGAPGTELLIHPLFLSAVAIALMDS